MKKIAFCILTALLAGLTACDNHTLPAQGTVTIPQTTAQQSTAPAVPLTASAADLTAALTAPQTAEGKAPDQTFITAQTGFALELLKHSVKEKPAENMLISPYSVMQALGMTANGTNNDTRTEMEQALGGIPTETLNRYLYSFRNALPSTDTCRLSTANSVWFLNDEKRILVNGSFLQNVRDYYGAQAFAAPFDESTVHDINGWCSNHTDGMIPKLLDEIQENAVMYLVNAVVFDGKWKTPYQPAQVRPQDFHNAAGQTETAQMMHSTESHYLHDDKATGFLKPYDGNKYYFAALMPNEGISLEDYIAGLDADSFSQTLSGSVNADVIAGLPKFTVDYDTELSRTLSAMGMPSVFVPGHADFSNLGDGDHLYISRILHKTHIEVDENGTKAAAVTAVETNNEAVCESYSVTLDRPFLYCILDAGTMLPIFTGTLNTLN